MFEIRTLYDVYGCYMCGLETWYVVYGHGRCLLVGEEHVFLLEKTRCLLVREEDVFLWEKTRCLLAREEDVFLWDKNMSSCWRRTCLLVGEEYMVCGHGICLLDMEYIS